MMFVYISMYEVLIRLLLSAVYFDCTVYMFLLLFPLCLGHDSVCNVLMGSGDWYHTHIVRKCYEGIVDSNEMYC